MATDHPSSDWVINSYPNLWNDANNLSKRIAAMLFCAPVDVTGAFWIRAEIDSSWCHGCRIGHEFAVFGFFDRSIDRCQESDSGDAHLSELGELPSPDAMS